MSFEIPAYMSSEKVLITIFGSAIGAVQLDEVGRFWRQLAILAPLATNAPTYYP